MRITTKKTAKDTLEITRNILTVTTRNKKWLENRKRGCLSQIDRYQKIVDRNIATIVELDLFLDDLENKVIEIVEPK